MRDGCKNGVLAILDKEFLCSHFMKHNLRECWKRWASCMTRAWHVLPRPWWQTTQSKQEGGHMHSYLLTFPHLLLAYYWCGWRCLTIYKWPKCLSARGLIILRLCQHLIARSLHCSHLLDMLWYRVLICSSLEKVMLSIFFIYFSPFMYDLW